MMSAESACECDRFTLHRRNEGRLKSPQERKHVTDSAIARSNTYTAPNINASLLYVAKHWNRGYADTTAKYVSERNWIAAKQRASYLSSDTSARSECRFVRLPQAHASDACSPLTLNTTTSSTYCREVPQTYAPAPKCPPAKP